MRSSALRGPKLKPTLKWKKKALRTPKLCISWRMLRSIPIRMATTPTRVTTAITTPRMVSPERTLWLRTVSSAIQTFSANSRRQREPSFARGLIILLLRAQGHDGIQPRSLVGGVDAEEQTHRSRQAHAQQDRLEGHASGQLHQQLHHRVQPQ